MRGGAALALAAGLAWASAFAQGPARPPASTPIPTARPSPSAAAQRKAQRAEEAASAGELRTALFIWQEAANLAPAHAPFRIRLGEAYEKMAFWDQAARQFDLAAALDPPGTDAQRRAERARAARDGRAPPPEPEPAAPAGQAGTPAASVYEAGVTFIAKGQYADAVASLDEAVRRDPRLSVAYTARASALFGLGKYVESAGDYRTSLALDPSQATPLFGLGECYRLLGQRDSAAEHYARYAQSLAPDVRDDLKAEATQRAAELRQ